MNRATKLGLKLVILVLLLVLPAAMAQAATLKDTGVDPTVWALGGGLGEFVLASEINETYAFTFTVEGGEAIASVGMEAYKKNPIGGGV